MIPGMMPIVRRGSRVAVSILLLSSAPTLAADPKLDDYIFWAPDPSPNTGKSPIHRAKLDGSAEEEWIPRGGDPQGVAVDPIAGKVYWTETFPGRIRRANLDGSDVETLLEPPVAPLRIALDVGDGKMYWTDRYLDSIQRADLDGGNVEDLLLNVGDPTGIALDLSAGKLYWCTTATALRKIQRANLDGTGVEDLLTTGLSRPYSIALDLINQRMYWVDAELNDISSAKLDGSDVQALALPNVENPLAIRVDPDAGHLYWSDGRRLYRADLNGENDIEITNTQDCLIIDLELVHAAGIIVLAESQCLTLSTALLDGSPTTELIVSGAFLPDEIAVDRVNQVVYYSDAEWLRRADSDGSAIRTVFGSATVYISGFALDATLQHLFWAEKLSGRIHRYGLDDESDRILTQADGIVEDLALDASSGMLYWVDSWNRRIQRARTDGTNVEDVVTGLMHPAVVDIDPLENTIYWVDLEPPLLRRGRIQRTSLDLLKVETVRDFDDLGPCLAVDPRHRRLYGSMLEPQSVFRLSTDGSGFDVIVDDSGPYLLNALALSLTPSGPSVVDFDRDGDVDLSDFATFSQCFGGDASPPAPGCPDGVTADLDGDGDVDGGDFAVFAQNFTGAQ